MAVMRDDPSHPPAAQPGRPPVLDMTPDGEFRETRPLGGGTWLDRLLLRIGGLAALAAVVAGGLVLVASAIVVLGLLLPVLAVAGGIAVATLWWRLRRARRAGVAADFVILRR